MKLIITRHGKTKCNLEGRMQGRVNFPLTGIGIKEMQSRKKEIKGLDPIVFTSPLQQARESVGILFPKSKIYTNELLNQIDIGELEGVRFSEVKDKFPDNKTVEYNGINFTLSKDGESFESVAKRCKDFIKYLKENFKDDQEVAIVTHLTNIEIMKALAENKPWHAYLGQGKKFPDLIEIEV